MTVAPETLDVSTAQLKELITDRRFRPLVHGTTGGYQRCRPSCDECRAAWAAYQAADHKKRRNARKIRMMALEAFAARHSTEYLALYEKVSRQQPC